MRLVAYLRGWASDLRHKCSPRCRITLARIVDVLGVAAPHGPAVVWYATRRVHAHMAERLPVAVKSVSEIFGRIHQASELRHRSSPRCRITLARIVDVLGVAAPHGPAVVCLSRRCSGVMFRRGSCQEVVTVWESECPAWDAWSNPVAEANDPSSLVSEYAACGVWRPHMVLPFSHMSLVAYLRGWASESVWEMVGRIAQAREVLPEVRITRTRIVDVLRLVAPQLSGGCNSLGYVSVCDIDGRTLQKLEVVFRCGCSLTGSDICLGDGRANCPGAGDVRGKGSGSVCCQEVVTVWESECPAWDAWSNPVAEANDPSSLVSEYAACGVWRPHTVLPFSRMSLVAYLRGWASEVVFRCGCSLTGSDICLGDGRAYCPGAGGAPRGAASFGHELSTCCVWWRHSCQEVVTVWVCLRDCWAFCSESGGGFPMWLLVDRKRYCQEVVTVWESECPAWDAWANPVAEANDPSSLVSEYAACGVWRPHTVLPFSRMSLVAYLRGWAAEVAGWDEGVGGGGWRAGLSGRWSGVLPRRGSCQEVVTVWESECPAWDAWANPVAEANDPSSLVSEYAACGVWRPHTVLPFSRMSLVAYLRGWASESVWEMVGRIAQAPEMLEEKVAGACGVSRGNCGTT
ncbi:hypothetical protein TGME49_329300 [Toxoplasma gondii ME49]|uniref:Uncharacterized protein n=1 Tax=Toxoplasma gondii (strain ATCC 50611 / Me49) TaxID=508771 RepID=S8EQF8_TOXGM|nr:hypothetical protein TGME49_329300 [Toxoplasma gondii ME49]EPT24422.1 hypothetical protein TGME49_329300 [Toxoplasma gondii ME49]|eukprot:XP_018634665.1 hypothetical protein TGME49_329300 [Toxoplasma gondii ME49]